MGKAKVVSGRQGSSNTPGSKQTVERSVFTVEKDVFLLKCCIQHNPWQTSDTNWGLVLTEVKEEYNDFPPSLSIRTLKDHVNRLVKQLKAEQLVVKTGKEEVCSERGTLLEEVIAILESAETPIHFPIEFDDENFELDIGGDIFNEEELDSLHSPPVTKKARFENKGKVRNPTEKEAADKERDGLLSALESDLAPSPKDTPRARGSGQVAKIKTIEDELLVNKQSHEFVMDKKRFELDCEKEKNEFQLECRKLDTENLKIQMEKTRLELEVKREERMLEENKRKEQNDASSIQLQSNMYQLLLKLVDKKDV